MKHLLPTVALASLAAAASAQLVPSVKPRGPSVDFFSVGATYSHLSGWPVAGGTSATTFDARFSIDRNFFLTASYTGMSPIGATIDPSAWSLGAGVKQGFGNGALEASYAYRRLDLTALNYNQNVLRLGYTLDLGAGFDVGLAVVEVINESGIDNLTAPVFSVGYRVGQNFSVNLGYSTENTLYGIKDYNGVDAGKVFSVGVRFGF